MLLVGFIIRIYDDARSPERQIEKCNVSVWAEIRGSGGGKVAGSCEQGNEPRVSIKVENFFSR